MPSATVNRILDSAKVRLPGSLDAALLMELFFTLEDFLRNTHAWRELLPFTATPATDPYVVDPAQYTFSLSPPSGTIPQQFFGVYDDAGRPQLGSMPVPGQVILDIPPPAPATFNAYVSLNITDPTDLDGVGVAPDWIWERYWPTFLEGLLARMMSQGGKPYTNAQMSLFHGRTYTSRRAQARVEVLRQNQYGGQTWKFPQTFNRT
jgi:hypothetical protein